MAGLPFSVVQMHQFRGANASREKILTDYQP
jgi:hypothetical protein